MRPRRAGRVSAVIDWLMEPEGTREDDPGARRHDLRTLDDWILFGPRLR